MSQTTRAAVHLRISEEWSCDSPAFEGLGCGISADDRPRSGKGGSSKCEFVGIDDCASSFVDGICCHLPRVILYLFLRGSDCRPTPWLGCRRWFGPTNRLCLRGSAKVGDLTFAEKQA